MIPIDNISKYKRNFAKFRKSDNKNFAEYLNQNNKSIMDFMLDMGLNKELIKSYNYQEIVKNLESLLKGREFPEIDFNHEYLNEQSLSLNVKDGTIILNADSVAIIKEEIEDFDDKETSITRFVSYQLVEKNIVNANMIVAVDFSKKLINGKETLFVSRITIMAREYKNNSDGHMLTEDKYTIRINSEISDRIYGDIYKLCFNGSIRPCLAKILDLLEKGYIKKEDLEITHNFDGLIKK